jgi:hypothetical protein
MDSAACSHAVGGAWAATMVPRSLSADGRARSLSKAGGMNRRSERGALSHWQQGREDDTWGELEKPADIRTTWASKRLAPSSGRSMQHRADTTTTDPLSPHHTRETSPLFKMAGCVLPAASGVLVARAAPRQPRPLPLRAHSKLVTDDPQLDLPREPCPLIPEGVPEA